MAQFSPAARAKLRDIRKRYPQILAEVEAEKPEILRRAREVRAACESQQRAAQAAVDQLRAERPAQGLTLADLSRRTGISKPALSRLENGRNANPTVETLSRYALALGMRIDLQVSSL